MALPYCRLARVLRALRFAPVIFAVLTQTGCLPKEGVGANSSSDGDAQKSPFGIKTATTVSATKVKITWSKSPDPETFAYKIYDTTNLFDHKLLKTVPASSGLLETTITNLTPQNYYSFRVKAADKEGKVDDNTNDLGAIPYGGITGNSVLDSMSASVTFNDGSNADEINIFCWNALDPIPQLVAQVTDVSQTSVTITDLTGGIEYTCRAALNIGGFIDNNSVTTKFTPVGTAAKLVFGTQPGSATAGSTLPVQPVIRILDANNTLVTAGPDSTATVTLTVSTSSPTSGTLRGTASVTAVGGIASFSGLSLREAGAKLITATKSDTSSQPKGSVSLNVDSAQFIISPDSVSPANSTIAVDQAGPLVADGNQTYSVTITLKDQYGNAVPGTLPQFDSTVSGDTFVQPTAQTNASGQTTGSISTTIASLTRNLFIKSPSGLTGVTIGAPFTHGPATKLAFVTQPANAGSGVPMAAMTVAVQDSFGNTVTSGPGASAPIAMAISANVGGATLSGTTPVTAVNGVASFNDLSINKTGNGYKLLASSGTYAPAYSNSFNITAGTPYKIAVTGATSVLSGSCSGAIIIQLQDSGNNPASAVQSTPVTLSGLGLGSLYTSSSCSGTAQGATLTFTAGTSTKTLYFKDQKAESVTITATDPSNVLTTGSLVMKVSPSKIALALTSSSVIAGQCSQAVQITPQGENGMPGPLFAPATVTLTGILGSSAGVYSDPACTQPLTSTAITLPITAGTAYTTNVYIKDNKAENLSLSVSDNDAIMVTVTSLLSFKILASNLLFAGPSSVVSGACSSAFTLTLKDAAGNSVTAPADTPLTINGLAGSTTGFFYINSSCSGTAISSSVTIPQGQSFIQLFFSDSTAETLNIYFSDPAAKLANSNTLSIGISPSAFQITGGVTSSKTTVCAGPFTLATLDGASNVTAAITPITALLSGAGSAGGYFSDSSCQTPVTQFVFAQGDQTKQFYYKGQYPEASLTFRATDQANVLTEATYAYSVTAAPGFLGTAVKPLMDASGNLLTWFQSGKSFVTSRYDGPNSVRHLHFSTDAANPKQYLYVADSQAGRILKYDYLNRKYIGWIGALWGDNAGNYIAGGKPKGSNLTTPSAAECIGTPYWGQTPGWCVGGPPYRTGNTGYGAFNQVIKVVDDGNGYIYALDRGAEAVFRYVADTGAFAGWIGVVRNTPVANASIAGLAPECTSRTDGQSTPGWCYGGLTRGGPTAFNGADNTMNDPRSLAYANGYLYVASRGAIKKFDATTGTYLGWVGRVGASSPTGGASGCAAKVAGDQTPGWCMGGLYQPDWSMRTSPGAINYPTDLAVIGTKLYALSGDGGGVISTFDVASGAFLGNLPGLQFSWTGPQAMVSDGNYIYVADSDRLIRVDPASGVVTGWVGKVSAQPTSDVAGAIPGCTTLAVNANTPGWCLGGTSNYGVDEGSFLNVMAIELDDAGNLIVGGRDWWYGASIQRFNATTGAYDGTFAFESASPNEWSNNANTPAELEGFDDKSMYAPMGIYNDGTHLYVAEAGSSRVKKINLKTGATVGWIGAVGSAPTGGDPLCIGQNAMSYALGWCLGSQFIPHYRPWNMIPNTMDGTMAYPVGVTGDGTFLYVLDRNWHRIQKFKLSDGTYMGWIGRVSSTTGLTGGTGCNTTPSGNFTPTWCKGGSSQEGTGNGHLRYPSGITYANGNLYVVDMYNHRVVSYDAATGAFKGWIGRIATAPTSGCTTTTNPNNGYTVSGSGWCIGGTSQSSPNDRGGGFSFRDSASWGGITTDGISNLYIANHNSSRIDKYSLSGQFLGGVSTNYQVYNNTWTTNSTALINMRTWNMYPRGIWTDGTHMFATIDQSWYNNTSVLIKMDLTTGNIVGWRGYILPNYPAANNGEVGKTGCAGLEASMTPEWCQQGVAGYSLYLGGFWSASSITGDAHFIYIVDEATHRMTRIPK